jgi:type IV pilus assembly protein PilA
MNKKGFTLIELLIVVVIIGILAAIAIPRFGETRERAFRSSIVSDLRNVQTLQEQYYFDNDYEYAGTIAALNFTPSDGVTLEDPTVDADGYTVAGTHTGWAGNTCTLTVATSGSSSIECTGDDP